MQGSQNTIHKGQFPKFRVHLVVDMSGGPYPQMFLMNPWTLHLSFKTALLLLCFGLKYFLVTLNHMWRPQDKMIIYAIFSRRALVRQFLKANVRKLNLNKPTGGRNVQFILTFHFLWSGYVHKCGSPLSKYRLKSAQEAIRQILKMVPESVMNTQFISFYLFKNNLQPMSGWQTDFSYIYYFSP